MIKIRLDFAEKKPTQFPDFETDCVPMKGDVMHVGGVRHLVAEREFWVDRTSIEHITLHLTEIKS